MAFPETLFRFFKNVKEMTYIDRECNTSLTDIFDSMPAYLAQVEIRKGWRLRFEIQD